MISVDRRERLRRDEPIFPFLYSQAQQFNPPIPVQEVELPYGDMSWTGNGPDGIPLLVGIERKTIPDLIGVIHDGRFAGHQLPGLSRSYNKVYLVVEGEHRSGTGGELLVRRGRDWAPPPGKPIQHSAIQNWLTTAEMCAGLYLKETASLQDTARFLFQRYQWFQKDWDEHRSHLAFDDSNELREIIQTDWPTLLRRVAKELPGIGWKKSKTVEAFFGDTYTMFQATVQDWMKIEGVGKTIAERIWKAIRTKGTR